MHNKQPPSFFRICLSIAIIFFSPITPHGFGEYMLIRAGDAPYFWPLGQVAHQIGEGDKLYVASYYEVEQRYLSKRVMAVGYSKTNCYCRVSFGNSLSRPLECTPTQLFYRVDDRQWIAAYMLRVGDLLLCDGGQAIEVLGITLINKPLRVYTLEVQDTHTFLVTERGIVAHNMLVPVATAIGFSVPLHLGCGGASVGALLGPVGLAGGVVIGGIIGYLINACIKSTIAEYELSFKPQAIETFMAANNNGSHGASHTGGFSGSSPGDPNDPNNKKERAQTTNQQDQEDAERLGYKRDKNPLFNSQGKHAFKKGRTWITADRTGHRGGRWKMFNSKGERLGTFDATLTKVIGD